MRWGGEEANESYWCGRVWNDMQVSNSIKFCLFYIAQFHKLRISLRGLLQSVHMRHPCTWTTHRIRKKLPRKGEKKLSQREKREETFRRATEEDLSHRMDRSNRWGAHQQGHKRRPTHQVGGIRHSQVYNTWSHEDSGEEAEDVLWQGCPNFLQLGPIVIK